MNKYRILSMILTLMMVLSEVFPIGVFAEDFFMDDFLWEEDEYVEEWDESTYFEEEQQPYSDEFYPDEIFFEDEGFVSDEWLEEEETFFEEPTSDNEEEAFFEEFPEEDDDTAYFELSDADTFDASLIEIVSQPEDCEAAVGDTATFTVEATGVQRYQWQFWNAANNKWINNKANATSASFSFTVVETYYANKYRCKLTGEDGSILYTNEVQILQPVVFGIVTQPENCEVAMGGTATFTVEAIGVASYQWQYCNAGSDTWANNKTNATSASFSFTTSPAKYGRKYRCMLTGEDGSVLYTDEVQVLLPVVLEIVTQPENCEVAMGGTATFTVEAIGVASYQWQYCNADSDTWNNNKTNATSASFSFTTSPAKYGRKYRCMLTGEDGNVLYTNEVQVLQPVVLEIVTQPENCEVAMGGTATFTVEAIGVASYQWQYCNAGSDTWNNNKTNATSASFSFTTSPAKYGRKYRCMLTGEDESVLYTDEVQVLLPVVFEIVTQPANCEAAVGDTATFTVEATGVQSYQWQFWNETTKKWNNNKANATSASFSFTVAETYYANKYRCKLTGEDGSVLYTDAVQIVKPGIIINEVTYEPIDSQNCRVVSYSGSATSLVIPQTVEGYTVTEIGEEAFMDKSFLASIDLPDTITAIRARAFKGCTNLSEMK